MFDCDGVLVDSETIAAVVDAEHLAEVGFKITPEEVIRRFAGLTSVDIVEIIESEIGRPLAPGFLKEQKEELDRRLAAEVKAVPGAHELLDRIDESLGRFRRLAPRESLVAVEPEEDRATA